MKLNEITPAAGSNRDVKRVGRGHGSGNGKTAGKGHKGQKARAGKGMRAAFVGGQMPLARRIPKRGFNNIFAKQYVTVKLETLNSFDDGATVDFAALKEVGIVKKQLDGVKILGNGTIEKKLTVKAAAFTESAKQKIEAAGGKAEVI